MVAFNRGDGENGRKEEREKQREVEQPHCSFEQHRHAAEHRVEI